MSVSTLPIDPETLLIDADGAREYGKAAAESYQSKSPYPYGCFDNFMPPEILEKVREELRVLPAAESFFNRPQEKLKAAYMPERLGPYTRALFAASRASWFAVSPGHDFGDDAH